MNLPGLPLVLRIKSVTAHNNGGIRRAEPYILPIFIAVDGSTIKLVQNGNTLKLVGEPRVEKTFGAQGNLGSKISDGQTIEVPEIVGRFDEFTLLPIPLPGELGKLIVGGASGIGGVVYALAERDSVPPEAVVAGYDTMAREIKKELKALIAAVEIDLADPAANPFVISDKIQQQIADRVAAKVKAKIKSEAGAVLNGDDILGVGVHIFTETSLLTTPSDSILDRFRGAGVPGDWSVRVNVAATVPADITRRRLVTMTLDKLTCVTPTDPVVGDAPYQWNVFFSVDASTVTLGEDLRLSGEALVVNRPSNGSHGNLAATGVGAGQTVQIPTRVGQFGTNLDLIRFPAGLRRTMLGGVSGVVGCVSLTLEADLVADDAAEAGHQAFNAEIKKILDQIVRPLGVGSALPSPADLETFRGRVEEKVRAAVLEEGNILEDLFAGLDPDDVIGFKVIMFTHADLLARSEQMIDATFTTTGKYTLSGNVRAVPS